MGVLRKLMLGLAALLVAPASAQGPLPLPRAAPAAASAPAANASPAPAAGVAVDPRDVEAFLDGFIPYAIARGHIAGAVVVVVNGKGPILEKGYGFADLAARKPVRPHATLFRPGSVSKLFTWTAVMQQVEAGKLDLDTDVNRYLDFETAPSTTPDAVK